MTQYVNEVNEMTQDGGWPCQKDQPFDYHMVGALSHVISG